LYNTATVDPRRSIMLLTKGAHRLAIVSALILFGIALRSQALGQASGRPDAKTITLAVVAEANQKEVEAHFQGFVHYVATKLSSAGNLEGRVATVPNQSTLANLLNQRKADFYMESPHPTYIINSVYGAGKLLLRRWKGGMSDYYSLIFTPKNGATKRLEDLQGKIVAFEDPESTSGYFLPKLFLSKKGFKLVRINRIDAKVSRGAVGYIFASSQKKLLDLVLTEQVAAGAFSSDDYAGLNDRQKSDLTILAETATLPRHLVSIRKDLAPAVSDRLKKILLSMHEDPQGRVILQKTDGTTKFDTLPGGELAISQRLLDSFYDPEKK
jgi:phosphonate transport system substrate-binding protein